MRLRRIVQGSSCEVCCKPEQKNALPENQIVKCVSCEVAVHRACYGILPFTESFTSRKFREFICDSCMNCIPVTQQSSCILCPDKTRRGIKLIKGMPGATIHLCCAVWNPEISFECSVTKRMVVIGDALRDHSGNLKTSICELCGIGGFPCVTCCDKTFHVTCAQKRELGGDAGYVDGKCPKCSIKHKEILMQRKIDELSQTAVKLEGSSGKEKPIDQSHQQEKECGNPSVKVEDSKENVSDLPNQRNNLLFQQKLDASVREEELAPPKICVEEEYLTYAAVLKATTQNSIEEPCFQGEHRKKPYPRREYEQLTEYTHTPGLTKEMQDRTYALLNTAKSSECDQSDRCAIPVPYDMGLETFDTDLKCKSRRVGCPRSAIGRRDALELGKEVDATDMWGIDCFVRQNIQSVFSIAAKIDDKNSHKVFLCKILLPVINVVEDDRAHELLYVTNSIIVALYDIQTEEERVKWSLPNGLLPAEVFSPDVLEEVRQIIKAAAKSPILTLSAMFEMSKHLFVTCKLWPAAFFRIHPKGVGVRCYEKQGLKAGTFVVEYMGELYPPWRWFEKQDAIKNAQRKLNFKPVLPDFYNIMLERHNDDPDGYDVVFVDPIVRGNYASRLCHSCDPNCATVVMAVNGKFVIALYTLRDLTFGEELTFDYSSVTEDENEFRAAVCLCGSPKCRGSFLYYAGLGAFADVIEKEHTFLERCAILVKSASECALGPEDQDILERNGMKSSVLKGMPDWLIKWVANILQFVEYEKKTLTEKFLEQKNASGALLYDNQGAELEARGVLENRRQNIVITLNKIRNFLSYTIGNEVKSKGKKPTSVFDPRADMRLRGPPVRNLSEQEVANMLWNFNDSRIISGLEIMLKAANPTSTKRTTVAVALSESEAVAMAKIRQMVDSRKTQPRLETVKEVKDVLLKIRDIFWSLKPRAGFLYDAAGDVLTWHIHTEHWFTSTAQIGVASPKIEIRNVDIGRDSCVSHDKAVKPPKNGFRLRLKRKLEEREGLSILTPKIVYESSAGESNNSVDPLKVVYSEGKRYQPGYLWGQLSGWYKQTVADPSASLSAERRGTISLPELTSCFGGRKPYKDRKKIIERVTTAPHQMWPTGTIWSFKNKHKIYGSPWLDKAFDKNSSGLENSLADIRRIMEQAQKK